MNSGMENVWGSNPADINPAEFCQFCEREVPLHYDNCPTRRKDKPVTITIYVNRDEYAAPFTVLSEDAVTELFDDMLNEVYSPVEMCGVTLYPATMLKECDPVAYRQAFLDHTDSAYHEFDIPDELEWDSDEFHEWIANAIEGNA